MKTELKDVVHFYLGCECVDGAGSVGKIDTCGFDGYIRTTPLNKHIKVKAFLSGVKPILRPLSDMTEEEGRQYATYYGIDGYLSVTITEENGYVKISIGNSGHMASLFPLGQYGQKPETLVYLLSKGFDLFGLIESGQAIDKTILTKI